MLLEQTTKCQKDYMCLKDEMRDTCGVKKLIYSVFLFVESMNCTNCPYHIDWGSNDICRCPLKIGLYKKYGK